MVMGMKQDDRATARHARVPCRAAIAFMVFAVAVLLPARVGCTDAPAQGARADAMEPLALAPDAVVATGNDWIALPEIRAGDGAIVSFNVLSMRDRGLLQVQGSPNIETGPESARVPAIAPWVAVGAAKPGLHVDAWQLIDDWIPVATASADGVRTEVTYATPPQSRAAWIRMELVNESKAPRTVRFGLTANWGGLVRVIYSPSMIRGQRVQEAAPSWIKRTQVFGFVENETTFAWALGYPDCPDASRSGDAFTAGCRRVLAPGQRVTANFIVSVGLEESSAEYSERVLAARLANWGGKSVLDSERAWLAPRLRSTGDARLDRFMNRNLLFSSYFAWGRTLDTEQFVGFTSRSPRYYVSAAYWDRDAMLWSFPALLATDATRARDALDVALGIQLRDAGTHSRYIDGVTLEPGYELDENAAPVIALAGYWHRTHDRDYLKRHRAALDALLAGIAMRRGRAGLYRTEQDSQDENRRSIYETYGNALVWRAFKDAAALYGAIGDSAAAGSYDEQARRLHLAIMKQLVAEGAPGADGPIFAFGWDGEHLEFDDVPPGSLLKLPALGFVSQDDPVFARTYAWLHSRHFPHSNAGKRYGLPGSYRLPYTTAWSIADHLRLDAGREQALKILRASSWDGGIVSEQLDPTTAASIPGGGAFATAAGYLASTVCDLYCRPGQTAKPETPADDGDAH